MAESVRAANVFDLPDFRKLLAANACATLAGRGLAVVLNAQVYDLTESAFFLACLGLIEAIPALSLALYGGYVADRYNRRWILRMTLTVLAISAAVVAVVAMQQKLPLVVLYAVAFIVGTARGFADPAIAAWEAQLVPPTEMVRASAWMSSTWLTCSIVGPVVAMVVFKYLGPANTYVAFATLFAAAWIGVTLMQTYPVLPPPAGESMWQSIVLGVKYVTGDQVLVGSMALDLFAVLFGGAIAILPMFADQILHTDEIGLGLLNAAPNAGALLTMALAIWRPPIRRAGRNLLVAVAGFGVSMIVFALSRNLWLSLAALAFAGMCDGVSVVVRRSIVRLLTPPHLRGRVAAVSMVFIGASNEIGAFESGLAAGWLGAVRSVWAGGLVTLAIVAIAAMRAPRLRRLRLDTVPVSEQTIE